MNLLNPKRISPHLNKADALWNHGEGFPFDEGGALSRSVNQAIPLGDLYLDVPTAVMIDAGTMDQNGGRQFSIPIGRDFPPATPLMFQVAAMTPGGLAMGAPVGVLMRNLTSF